MKITFSLLDVEFTQAARYQLPLWQRLLMPWKLLKRYRKPSVPFPDGTTSP